MYVISLLDESRDFAFLEEKIDPGKEVFYIDLVLGHMGLYDELSGRSKYRKNRFSGWAEQILMQGSGELPVGNAGG